MTYISFEGHGLVHHIYHFRLRLVPGFAGELFYASGEVAVKPAHMSSSAPDAPRLGVLQAGLQEGGSSVPIQSGSLSPQQGEKQDTRLKVENIEDVERLLKEANASLALAETRMAELAREGAQARFDCEDAQARYSTDQTKV